MSVCQRPDQILPLIGRPFEQDTTIKHMMETIGHRPPAGPCQSQEDRSPRHTRLFDSLCSVNTSRSKAPDETDGLGQCHCRGRDEEKTSQTFLSAFFRVQNTRPNMSQWGGRVSGQRRGA